MKTLCSTSFPVGDYATDVFASLRLIRHNKAEEKLAKTFKTCWAAFTSLS